MIRLSSPELARGSPGPKASIRSTRRPRSAAVSAIQVPMTPAPTTTRSGGPPEWVAVNVSGLRSTWQLDSEAPRLRGPHDRVGEDQIRKPDAEVRDDDPARRPGRPCEDRLADRGCGIGIAVELA